MASHLVSKKSPATSRLSTLLATRNVAIKWKSSLVSYGHLSRNVKDPGTFDVKLNDNPETRELIKRSKKCFREDCLNYDESGIGEPQSNYTLTPSNPFNVALARESVRTALRDILDDEKNSGHDVPNGNLCKLVTDEIKQRLKTVEFLRYKIVSVVYLVHGGKGQEILIASRCLWNTNFDNFVQEIFQNEYMYAIATVYAIYCD